MKTVSFSEVKSGEINKKYSTKGRVPYYHLGVFFREIKFEINEGNGIIEWKHMVKLYTFVTSEIDEMIK